MDHTTIINEIKVSHDSCKFSSSDHKADDVPKNVSVVLHLVEFPHTYTNKAYNSKTSVATFEMSSFLFLGISVLFYPLAQSCNVELNSCISSG